MSDPARPRERYVRRAAEQARERATLEAGSRRLGTIRFLTFFVALAPWVAAEVFAGVPEGVGWASVPLAFVFFTLVGRHRRLRARLRRVEVGEALSEAGVARIDRRWDALPEPAPAPERAGGDHPWAADLDLYGHASLRSLLGPVSTPPGRETLDAWLLETADPATARARQAAVRELAPQADLREAAAVEGALLDAVDARALDRFLEWCGTPPLLPRGVTILAWLLPALTAVLVVGDVTALLPGWWWAAPLAVQAILSWRWGPRLHETFARASSGVPGLRRYHRLFRVWETSAVGSPLLAESVAALRGPEAGASASLARLERWLQAADARFSSLHPVLAVGVLWDLHVGRGLDGWRDSAGRGAAGWMEALGRLEALSAVATLAADHPDWAFPTFVDDVEPPVFEARALGHPLLPEDVAVRNDVTVGPPGRLLLVTGSNMSGKSTLLRSIGLAVVLAGTGAPVCAREVRLPACRLFTSMRVQDSIEAGVSFFMAELKRLAALLAEAPPEGGEGSLLFYLVDEILQGTNSDERRIAGRRLVRHLLRRRAIGAVTTHDLEFHRHPEVERAADLVHFRESVEGGPDGPSLTFDYRLREGLATTRNALLLAERVGLTDPDAGPLSQA